VKKTSLEVKLVGIYPSRDILRGSSSSFWFSNNESLDPSSYKHHELNVKTLALRSITAV